MGVLHHIERSSIFEGSGIRSVGLVLFVLLLEGFVNTLRQSFPVLALFVVVKEDINVLAFASGIDVGYNEPLKFALVFLVQFVHDIYTLF